MSTSAVQHTIGTFVTSSLSTAKTAAQTVAQAVPPFLQTLAHTVTRAWYASLPFIQAGAALLVTRGGVAGLCLISSFSWFAVAKSNTHHTPTALTAIAMGTLALLASSYLFMTSGIFPTPSFLHIPSVATV